MSRPRELKLGIIADTHGLYDAAVEEHFSGVSEILHAGDIGNPLVITRLERIAPVLAVSGNIDHYESSGWPRQVLIRRNRITIGLRHVLYEKGQLTREAQTWLDRERPAICIFGHSHRPIIGQYRETILFNPGSAGPRRFSLPRGIGVLCLFKGEARPQLIALPDKAAPGALPHGSVRRERRLDPR
jgi:uncharacterized protein